MMTQTLAIFTDTYRDLRSKRMLWVVLLLSGIVLLGFASIGVRPHALTVLAWELPFYLANPQIYYAYIYLYAIAWVWLSFGATGLAFISVSSLFPEFLAGGSAELFIARPISRLRLFLTRYLAGLLFVALQLMVFAVSSYLVLGIRGHMWRASVFLSVPIVLCFFSYLYCVNVLIGVRWRSTLAALLLTLLAWVFFWAVQQAEMGTFQWCLALAEQVDAQENIMRLSQENIDKLSRPLEGGTTRPASRILADQIAQHDMATAERDRLLESLGNWKTAHGIIYAASAIFPKVLETTALQERYLISDAEVQAMYDATTARTAEWEARRARESREDPNRLAARAQHRRQEDMAEMATRRQLRSRSLTWVVGTSLLFESVVVSAAAWVFCRRDY
jgi:hypothetical protein